MRKLEFRATRKDTKETFEVLSLDWIHSTVFLAGHMIDADMDKVIIQQFTGLLDNNGTKIFEGDIVCRYGMDTSSDSYFEWVNNKDESIDKCLMNLVEETIEVKDTVTMDRFPKFWLENESFGYDGEDLQDPSELVVIGNIHEVK